MEENYVFSKGKIKRELELSSEQLLEEYKSLLVKKDNIESEISVGQEQLVRLNSKISDLTKVLDDAGIDYQ